MKTLFSTLLVAAIGSSAAVAQNVPVPGTAQTIIGGGTNKVLSLSTSAW
jgi:hypothetical protein